VVHESESLAKIQRFSIHVVLTSALEYNMTAFPDVEHAMHMQHFLVFQM